ncbi:MAG: hypothetical protein GYB66_00660 [Chloroflexi bacterium]|nr:hypothetical protein [Chloroflexota bacterium]
MDLFPKARNGIQLAQAGRRPEALEYLRQSVRSEAPDPEVWLWLAHVTPDIHEYRYSVERALVLSPNHPVGRQMQATLYQQYPQLTAGHTAPPASGPAMASPDMPATASRAVDADLVHSVERRQRRRRSQRVITGLLLLFLLGLGLAGAALLLLEDQTATDSDTDSQSVRVTVDSPSSGQWTFALQIPETWLLADSQSTEWQKAVERVLAAQDDDTATALPAVWQRLEADLSEVRIDPETGTLQPHISFVETSVEQLQSDSANPPRLQLVRILETPDELDGTTCPEIERLAELRQSEIERIDAERQSVIGSGVQEPAADRCVFVVHFRDRSPLSGLYEHIYVVHIPAGEDYLAEWHLNVTDSYHDRYRDEIEMVIDSLRTVGFP